MNKHIFTVTCILLAWLTASAQRSEHEIALREYFIDAEFFLAQEFYYDALSDYLQVYRRGYEDNANINYKIGICYLNISGQKHKAIEYLEKAKDFVSPKYHESSLKEKNAPIDVYLFLGNAYRVNNMLDKAIKSYREYKKLLPEEEKNLHHYADQQIEACNMALKFMQNPIEVEFENIGPVINKSNDNYKAVVSGDGSAIVYMHRLPFYDAVYFSKNENGTWTEPENITPQIMSDGDQFVASLSYDGRKLFLTKEDAFNSDIYVSHYVDNRWMKSLPLGPNINTKYWESHASVTKDGKTLYFTSNRKEGQGEMDIYVSSLDDEGRWGPARNLGPEINSGLNEDTPFITEDNRTLYFSSQGFTNMGGYDIFKSVLTGENAWSAPQNLGYPVNTTDDDLFYYPWDNGKIAYMARLEDDGYGATDIYKVIFPVVTEEIAEKEEIIPDEGKPVAEVTGHPVIDTADTTQVEEKAHEDVPVKTKTVAISPVFFAFDESRISTKSIGELKKLSNVLNDHSGLSIVLLGYTDPIGSEEYNLKLAGKRAKAVMDFLTEQGIDAERLETIAKGEADFIAVNTNPDGSDNSKGRKYNRRVEFEIIGIDNNVLVIKRIDPVPDELKLSE
ncbi:MAG: OmpA family protein [Bacteroidales bacterium]|jgi:outer membrane protein OmpA-like peptidoglycan-associated protein/tetratricopeptide (TPR) repeat protein